MVKKLKPDDEPSGISIFYLDTETNKTISLELTKGELKSHLLDQETTRIDMGLIQAKTLAGLENKMALGRSFLTYWRDQGIIR